ncbi:hypothetical protein TruAng_007829 [Truncatella angustata]|nr:hypothetical protein TruAng_007829 [Truncatella angustata]
MQVGPQCWTCFRGRVLCDGGFPACSTCKRHGVQCPGYDGAGDANVVRGDGGDATLKVSTPESSASYEELGMELAHFTSDHALKPTTTRSPVFHQPTPALYRKAQMIFEGLDYFNQMICPDLVSLESHFNPYKVNLQGVDKIPDIYVKVLVSVASFHRLMSVGPDPTPSSALIQKDTDVFQLRVEALQGLNEQLSSPDQQTSDATLLVHLEGARRIIQLRGGLKKIITVNPYFKPVLTFFMLIDVMGATTTPSSHADMPLACNMAMKYWEVEPSVFQLIATTCIPCPDVLFRVLILVNYLRTVTFKENLRVRRQSGTKMAIEKVMSFSPAEYSARMQQFKGWSLSGKEVGFDTSHESPQTVSSSSPSLDKQSSADSSPATHSSPRSDGDLWLSVGVTYRASTLLYTFHTLVFDCEDDASMLLPDNIQINVVDLRQETFEILYSAMVPVFADPVSLHQIGKLIMWPLFILGMETDYRNVHVRSFVTSSFLTLSHVLGIMSPIGIINELETKWRIDDEQGPGAHVKWDDYLQGREDFIVF